jgi:hypothetical protein
MADFCADAVHAFVYFLYHDRLEEPVLQKHCGALMTMADMYEVPALLLVCEKYLTTTASVEITFAALVHADSVSSARLRQVALDRIRDLGAVEVMRHKKSLQNLGPELMYEVMSVLMGKGYMMEKLLDR